MKDTPPSYGTEPLPNLIPVFPLTGVLLLPRGQLPLNIFEPRYRAMVEDSLKSHRIIGMIQPCGQGCAKAAPSLDLYRTGCAGRITSFAETDDGRYLITLTGVSRFAVKAEIPQLRGYRSMETDWSGFENDLHPAEGIDFDRTRLRRLLTGYFALHDLSCDWDVIDSAPDERLINCLSMICPLEPREKQALLEAPCCRSRADMFMTMLEVAVHGGERANDDTPRH
jgi:Lon protease-like protein